MIVKERHYGTGVSEKGSSMEEWQKKEQEGIDI